MTRTLRTFATLAALALPVAAAACHSPEPAQSSVAGLQTYSPPALSTEKAGTTTTTSAQIVLYNMYEDDSVRSVCAGPDPFFSFNSTNADSDAQPTMDTLATCMKTGPLAGKRITLTGRTDPRGSEEYNKKLGLERADRVKRYLVAHGVDANRIDTSSLGKDDASPAPKDWALDRRVEIRLAQ